MKIAFNPSTVAALTTPPNNKDITFDLRGRNIFARGVKFYGTDTNTWRDIKINNVSIGSNILDLRNGSNTTLTNINGVVTINSTWRPVVDNLTSDSTTSSLSAKQGKVLKALIDGKSNSDHNHDGRYVRYYSVTTLDCNNLAAGLTAARISATNAAHTNHSAYLYISDVGTPFQIQIPDSSIPYIYKRYYGSGGWSGWFKLNAGYADSAGSVAWANITGKPSSYTPSAHTHAWNSLTHSSTTENQAILTNGKANGWKLLTLNIARWDNAANNAHSHANKSVLDGITSALVNSWNTAYNFVSSITGTDADKVINKWEEIVNFLAGITEDNKLNTLLNSKLSILLLSAKDILTTKTNNALFWVDTIGNASTITTGPFTDRPYALLSVTNYNLNAENHKFFYRSRLAFSSAGDIKVASCHHENEYQLDEIWYNVLTSKNSGISGSTIKLNGTSITVYSSGTADGRYVKKTGDTMFGALNFANGTWNLVGDDSYMGDCNVSGHFGIKAANTTYPGISFFNNANDHLGNLTAYSGNIKYGAYSLQFLDNGNTRVSASTWTNPFNNYNSNAVADGQAICVWGLSSYLGNLSADTGDMSLWLKRVNAKAATLNMVLDGEYYANGNLRLAHVSEIPNSLKNPYALTISLNGTSLGPYDGSAAKNINITPGSIGAATSDHNHINYLSANGLISGNIDNIWTHGTYGFGNRSSYTGTLPGNSSYGGFLVLNPNATTTRTYYTTQIALLPRYFGYRIYDDGIWYDWKEVSMVGHNHDGRYVYNYGETQMDGASINKNALGMATNSGITEDWWHILQAAWNGEYRWNSLIAFPTLNRNGMYYRSGLDDNSSWGDWVKLLDINNYSSTLDSRYYTESEVNSLLNAKLNRQNLSYGTWNPRGYHLAADYHYNGGDLSISESGGKIHVSIDGYFWLNEGKYRVLDTSDVAGLKSNLTVHLYLSNTDTTWFPLVWGGNAHLNTSDSTGAVYKSYDKLSWLTSSLTLYATNIQTNNIKNLSIGGGIYWNPNVESASDNTDAASITLVKSGVAGGTTLVLSLMNDANDTILFKTNAAARLYHNSYPILTTLNTYVNNNKGYINGTEITLVNNSDTIDGWHKNNIQWTGYITSGDTLASYWFKMYDITVTGYRYNDITITFLVSEGYSSHFSIFYLRIRLNGTNNSGNYNLDISLYELVGNLRDTVVAYYNNSTGNVLLWGNTGGLWGTMNYTVLKKTTRTATDSYSLGTLTAQSFSSVQTPPSTGYSKVTMSRVGSVSYSDSTGSVHWNNVTNKPSAFNPAPHTHIVFKNNLMIKGTNGISDSASIHLGIGDSDTGFKWISDGVCLIYANNAAVGLWTSGGMNWFKNPTVNGNKVWNAGNDGSGSGLDADTVDSYHSSSFLTKHTREGAYNIDHLTDFVTRDLQPKSEINIEGTKPYDGWGIVTVLKTDNGTAQLVFDGGNNFYFRSSYGAENRYVTSAWKQVANLSSNVASATKLQTPRTIWGQSFDGTADVNGPIRVHSKYGDWSYYNEGIRLYGDSKDNSWSNIHFGCDPAATSGSHANQWFIGRNLSNQFGIFHGTNADDGIILITTNNNVGIGTTSPAMKLHVNGDGIYLNSTATCGINMYSSHGESSISYKSNGGKRTVFGTYTNRTFLWNESIGEHVSILSSNGYFGIGTNTPTYKLHVVGDIYSSATIRTAAQNRAIVLSNNSSPAWISALEGQVIFNTGKAIRFGETTWDWNQWAGLKYTHSNKTIYLGIADGSAFNANSALSGGILNLRAGISNIDLNSGTSIRGLATNGSPYSSRVTLNDTSISLSAYGDISMSTGPGAIELSSGYGGIKLSCLGNNASINSEGFKVEASRGVYLNSGNSGNVSLCQGGGSVGIGTTTPSYKLDVNGLMRAGGFHHSSVNSDNYILLAGGGYKSFGGDDSTPIFLGCLDLYRGDDGTISSSFYCLGYSVPFTYTRGGNYCKIVIPDTARLSFYIIAAIASVNYSGGGMDTWVGEHRGDGAWWLHCLAFGWNEVRVKGFRLANGNNDSWWGGNPLYPGDGGANKITVCIFGHVKYK